MADFAINDAKTSCTHEGTPAGQKCSNCGKLVPADPSSMPEEWKGDATKRIKNA